MKQGKITVYKASAGSGKTFTLAASFIELLLNTEDATAFRHVLAVTFTNKATAEMKERIIARLYDLAHELHTRDADNFREEMRKRLPHLTDEQMKRRAAAALQAILHDYDHFAVTTIDSFFQTLLTHLAHELGLSSGFRVDINDKEVVSRAVDRLMEALPTRPKLMAALITYVLKRIEDNKNWNPTFEMKELGEHLLKEKVLQHDEKLEEALADPQATGRYVAKLRTVFTEALKHLTQAANDFLNTYTQRTAGVAAYKGVKEVVKFATRLHTAHAADDKTKALKAPGKTINKMIDSADEWLASKYQGKSQYLTTADALRKDLDELDKMRQEVLVVANSYRLSTAQLSPLGLMNEIRAEMNRLNRENNRVLLAKTPQLLSSVVGDNDTSFVFERVGTRFHHVMIDEFQDTSVLQWDIFRRLLIESISSIGSCLLVGDVKQGIYRFRNGDWRILQDIESEMGQQRVETHHLETNFRSGDVLIGFNNAFFAEAALKMDSYAPDTHVASMYADVEQQCSKKQGGYVRVCIDLPRPKDKDKQQVDDADKAPTDTIHLQMEDLAKQIKTLQQQGLPLNEIAILVRYRYMAETVIEHFVHHHPEIKLVSDEAFLLSSSPLLQTLIHALRYVVCPENVVARLHVATYMSRRTSTSGQPSMPGIVENAASLLPDILKFSAASSDTERSISPRKQLLSLPLYELCRRLLSALSPEIPSEEAPYVCSFLDHVINLVDDGAADAEALIDLWDESLSERAVPAGETDGVRVLTIHKSKGLAFHTVLLPLCNWEIEADRTPSDMQWFAPGVPPYDSIPLLPINVGKAAADSIYAKSYAEEHRWRRIENLNLLYVAFTRAKYNLYVWSSTKGELCEASSTGDLIHAALPRPFTETTETHVVYEIGEPAVPQKKAADDSDEEEKQINPLEQAPDSIHYALQSYESRACFRQSNESKEFVCHPNEPDADQQRYIDQGKLLHKLLSGVRTHEDLPPAIKKMLSEGLLTSAEAASVLTLLQKRMAAPEVNSWFDGSWEVFNECGILARDENGVLRTQRPDRVMTKNGESIVVDFKFGRPQLTHKEQVQRYMQLLRQMGHPHVSGHLWYVYDGRTEEVCLAE